MSDNAPVHCERRQTESGRQRSRSSRIIVSLAIVFFGGALIALLLVLSARAFFYPYLFGVSAVLAIGLGTSIPVSSANPVWGRSSLWIAVATIGVAGLLTASVLLYIALDVDLIRRFCDIVPGNTGDRKLEGNASCNYAYGRMALYFLNFFVAAIAPFVEFAVLLSVILAVRRKVAARTEA